MRCFLNFMNDRTCDLCKKTQPQLYEACYNHMLEKKNLCKKANKCKFREETYEGHTLIYICTRDDSRTRYAPLCNPEAECFDDLDDLIERVE